MGLYLTSFLCGAVIMVLEILGFRLLPPYFGYLVGVWGCLLGVVVVALTAGYDLGEHRPDPAVPALTDDRAPVEQLIYDAFFGG